MKKIAFVVGGLLAANAAVNVALPVMAKPISLGQLAAKAGSKIVSLVLVPAPITYKKMVDAA